jgi:hypothetical protein
MSNEPALIPEKPKHEVRVVKAEGPWGGPTLEYRGARIEAAKGSHISAAWLEGWPLHGVNFGAPEIPMRLLDVWIDEGRIPPPYIVRTQLIVAGPGRERVSGPC